MTDEQIAEASEAEGFFEKGKGRQGLFFQLFDGSICIKSKEIPTEPGWEQSWDPEPVETMNPRTKETVFTYVKRFDKLICRVVDVNKRKAEFEKGGKITNWNFTVMAGKKRAVLQTTYMDALLRKLLKVAPNIDFEKPIMFGAFRKTIKGKDKQLISIRQGGTSRDSDDWVPVPFYWQKKEDEDGKPIMSTPAKGPDGTVMPDVDHDEDEDTYDSKEQNKFLAKHFVAKTLPKIKEIAERLGIKADMTVTGETPTHTGPEIPVVTERPDSGEAKSVSDAMTHEQQSELKKLAKQVKKDPDELAQKFLDCDLDDLSIEGAAYLKYRIEKRIKKARDKDPDAFPEPEESSKIRKAQEDNAKKKKKARDDDDDEDDDDDDEDSDDWEAAPAPKSKKKSKGSDDDDDDDDTDFGDDVLKDEDGNTIF